MWQKPSHVFLRYPTLSLLPQTHGATPEPPTFPADPCPSTSGWKKVDVVRRQWVIISSN